MKEFLFGLKELNGSFKAEKGDCVPDLGPSISLHSMSNSDRQAPSRRSLELRK